MDYHAPKLHPLLVFVCTIGVMITVPTAGISQACDEGNPPREALELVQLTFSGRAFRTAMGTNIESYVDRNFDSNPAVTNFLENVMQDFVDRYIWTEMRCQVGLIWAENFTRNELEALIKFYRTDLGQKLVRVRPTLMRKATEVGEELVKKHRAELQKMLTERLRQYQKATDTTASSPF